MLRHIFVLTILAPLLCGRVSSNESLSNNFAGTKERPELNPILSALINEDVMRSIESKRAAEIQEKDKNLGNSVLTTTAPRTRVRDDDQVVVEDDLMEEAGSVDSGRSEQGKKSKLEVRKGPNGVDDEYEVVYYYYYDDDDNSTSNKGKKKAEDSLSSASVAGSSDNSVNPSKTAYVSTDRSTTPTPDNDLARDGKEVEEGRLPFITRFPPRANDVSNEQSLDAGEGDSSVSSTSSGKKIVRPSLDLVDSDSFNTNEKQVKNNRNLENETNKQLAASAAAAALAATDKETGKSDVQSRTDDVEIESKPTEVNSLDGDSSTTAMADKNLMELTEVTTEDNSDSTVAADDGTTLTNSELLTTQTAEPTTSTTTTTTTEAPTTTTTTEAPTTTTTTTIATPSKLSPLGGARRGLSSGGRNRFRFNAATASTSTEASPAVSEETERSVKTKNRFQRPSFGGRSKQTTSPTSSSAGEAPVKEETKPTSSSGVLRGRTRNRFNLRGQVTTEKSVNENSVDQQQPSTASTSKPSRSGARPTFNSRRRGRPSAGATTSAPSSEPVENDNEEKQEQEKPTQPALPPRSSRFNLNRPSIGGNRLLPGRSRPGGLRVNLPGAAGAAAGTESEKKTDESSQSADGVQETTVVSSDPSNSDNAEATSESTTQATGLNRIRNRPRIQINPKAAEKPKPQISIPNRKISPLLPRRKIALGSTTTEAPAQESEQEPEEQNEDEKNEDKSEEQKDDEPEQPPVEVTSEQPRGLGLLGNRRRLQLRKPGTLL